MDSSGNEVYCEEAEDVADSDEHCCRQLEWDNFKKSTWGYIMEGLDWKSKECGIYLLNNKKLLDKSLVSLCFSLL